MNSSTTVSSSHSENKCKISCDFEILRNSSVFRSTNIDVVKLFAYLAKRKKYSPGDAIISSGKEADKAYLLIQGDVELTADHKGKEVVIQHLEEGAFFGELSLLASFKWFFNAYASSDCEVLIVEREAFEKVLEKFPEKRQRMTEKVVQLRVNRLAEQTSYMIETVRNSGLEETSVKKTSLG